MNLAIDYPELKKQYDSENNLLARLKPEFIKKLNDRLDSYPSNTKVLIEILGNEVYLTHLKYTYILDLQLLTGLSNIFHAFNDTEPFHEFLNKKGYEW